MERGIKIEQHSVSGAAWFAGWLFTIGYLQLAFWKAVLAIVLWPYYLGVWLRYGHAAPPDAEAADPLLDRFMPSYDMAERHHIQVAAPAEITFGAAREIDGNESRRVRAIFQTREDVHGA